MKWSAANPPPLVRPGEKTLFTPVRDWLAQRTEISWPAKFLYARLERYAGKRLDARPTQAALAREMGVKPRSLRNYIAELRREHEGMPLIWVAQTGDGGAARYLFTAHPWRAEVPVDNSGRAISARQIPATLNGSARQIPATLNGRAINERARAFGDNEKRRQPAAVGGAPPAGARSSTKAWAAKNQKRLAALVAGIGKNLN